ncbi:hypothetical protein [Mucilaginibacter sp.]|uniref:hypothetical protein n=1 Tax=Mucilaginibacter sp. TaxID=1882438 RepID=UPI0035BC2F29
MTDVNYPLALSFVIIAFCLMFWIIRTNQKDKNDLKKMLPGHKYHRKHLKKNDLNI